MSESFDQFAIVELFGRQMIDGRVSEQVIGGQGYLRVDVPATDDQEAFTKFYGGGAVYAITPTDEKSMLAAVRSLRKRPIDVWKLNLPALTAGRDSGPEWTEEDWGDEDE